MFIESDIDRIMGWLCYPITKEYKSLVVAAGEVVSNVGGTIAENRIIGYLNELDALQIKFKDNSTNGGSNLRKANNVEWGDEGKDGGMKDLRGYYLNQLRTTLNLKPHTELYSSSTGNVASTLYRS